MNTTTLEQANDEIKIQLDEVLKYLLQRQNGRFKRGGKADIRGLGQTIKCNDKHYYVLRKAIRWRNHKGGGQYVENVH